MQEKHSLKRQKSIRTRLTYDTDIGIIKQEIYNNYD